MKVVLFSLSKKPNSTKQPTGTGKMFECVLKAPTSILNPSLDLTGLDTKPTAYNYAYIPDFSRYYYIDNWTSGPRNLWTCDLSVDALASFKSDIGDQTLYVTRCSSASDGTITDTMYPTKNVWSIDKTSHNNPFNVQIASGSFCVGVIGTGQTKYYLMSPAAFSGFFDFLLGTDEGNFTEATLGALNIALDSEAAVVVDPLQYIKSIVFIPHAPGTSLQATINVGYVSVTIQGATDLSTLRWLIYDTAAVWDFTVPRHPDASTRGAYLNNAPFAEYYLYVPGFGRIDLNPSMCAATSTIKSKVILDYRTGNAVLLITDNDGNLISRVNSVIGVPIEVGRVVSPSAFGASGLHALGSALNIVGAAVSSGPTGIIGATAGAIETAINHNIPSANSVGSNGSFAELYGDSIEFVARFARPVAEDNSHRGRPLCQLKKISTIPGYIMISDSDIDIACYPSEREEIMAALTGGFFYE